MWLEYHWGAPVSPVSPSEGGRGRCPPECQSCKENTGYDPGFSYPGEVLVKAELLVLF